MNNQNEVTKVMTRGIYKACSSAYRMAFNSDRFDYSYGQDEAWLEALRDVDYYLRSNTPEGVPYYGEDDDYHTADVFLSEFVRVAGGDSDLLAAPFYDRAQAASLISDYNKGFINKHVLVQCACIMGCKRFKSLVTRMSISGNLN